MHDAVVVCRYFIVMTIIFAAITIFLFYMLYHYVMVTRIVEGALFIDIP